MTKQQKAIEELRKVFIKYNINIYATIFETYVISVDNMKVAEVNSLKDFIMEEINESKNY